MPNTHVYPERYPQSNRPPGKFANLVGRILRTLYKQIKVWNESKTYHLNIETKKCLFSFEMGI